MLTNNAVDRAIHYLLDSVDQLASWGDLLQLSTLDLIRKVRHDRIRVTRGAPQQCEIVHAVRI